MTSLPRVLVVEDKKNWQLLYKVWLKKTCRLNFAVNKTEAIEQVRHQNFDVIIMDLGLPHPEQGIAAIQEILTLCRNCKIIVVSGFKERELHRQVQQLGAYAVFQKDERLESEIPLFVRKAFELTTLEKENQLLRENLKKSVNQYQILGNSEAAKKLRGQVKNLSLTDTPALITGPTGTGKNCFARLVHQMSERAGGPFVVINCAAIPQDLVESELFGHEKGAFTGAETETPGKFRMAHGGTIVLDEISEIPISTQAKLLQVIEEKIFYPVGAKDPVWIDVRIMATTNRDLYQELKNGNFRRDLYYRLAGFIVHIPPLIERKEDIPAYFDHFLKLKCEEDNIPIPEVSADAYEVLQSYSWPGNLRELKNMVSRILISYPLKIDGNLLRELPNNSVHPVLEKALQQDLNLKEFTAQYVHSLYKKYKNKAEVAKILQIDPKTVNRYLNMKRQN
ncbi:MAG: hypothetical protein Kow0042_12250 [Calditrichia bacterium]